MLTSVQIDTIFPMFSSRASQQFYCTYWQPNSAAKTKPILYRYCFKCNKNFMNKSSHMARICRNHSISHKTHLFIQLVQLMRQVAVLRIAAIDLTVQLPLLVAQAKQLLPLLELLSLESLELLGHCCQPPCLHLYQPITQSIPCVLLRC